MTTPHIVTISGPSLSGKTELSKILQKEYGFNSIISVTTRPQRGQEQDGIDYYFLTEEEYSQLKLVQKTNFNGYNYGVSEKEVLGKKEAPIIWVVAPGSIEQIEKYCIKNNFNITKIFVTNPSEVIYHRLFTRFKEDTKADIETYVKRLNAMLNIENGWVKESQENPEKYDIIIDEFNTENTLEKVSLVLEKINGSKKNNKKKL